MAMANSSSLGGEFATDLENGYKCTHCKFTLQTPFQTACGHRFCKECIELIMSGPKECSEDGQTLREHEIFRDRSCERQILQQLCLCSSKERGFKWSGPFELLEDHEAVCPYIIIACPRGCQRHLPRSKIHEHFSSDCSIAIGNSPMD